MRWLIPPILFVLCAIAMVLLARFAPIAVVLHAPWNLIGLAPIAAGCVLGALGAGLFFFREHTNVHPFHEADKLVTGGIFRYTRNPMYLGLALILCGIWCLTGAISPVAGIVVFIIVSNRFYIAWEEQMLREKFGAAYEEYCRRVRRWL